MDTGKTTARRVKGEENNVKLGRGEIDHMTIETDKEYGERLMGASKTEVEKRRTNSYNT